MEMALLAFLVFVFFVCPCPFSNPSIRPALHTMKVRLYAVLRHTPPLSPVRMTFMIEGDVRDANGMSLHRAV